MYSTSSPDQRLIITSLDHSHTSGIPLNSDSMSLKGNDATMQETRQETRVALKRYLRTGVSFMPQLTTLRRARLGSKPLKCDLHKLSVKVREAFGLLCSASCGGIPAARRLRVSCLGVALSGGNGVK